MRRIGAWWFVLVFALMMQTAAAFSPESDIVAVMSEKPVSDVKGLLSGQQVRDRLRGALEMVRSGVAKAARQELRSLDRQLVEIEAGKGPEGRLPSEYWTGEQLWLPVEADDLTVMLDAPDVVPRPSSRETTAQPGNLPARARRTSWLSLTDVVQRVNGALAPLGAGERGQRQAQSLLEAALQDIRITMELQDRTLILAYYQVQSAIAALPTWDDSVRDGLRHAAESLKGIEDPDDLAGELRAQSNRLSPDPRELYKLSSQLRTRIVQVAGPVATPNSQGKR